ncbi:MAG: hypothetical protein H7223_05280 [Pedobacter sp.]|nr:hypothetical protein [Pedobacter sp.]
MDYAQETQVCKNCNQSFLESYRNLCGQSAIFALGVVVAEFMLYFIIIELL